MPVNGDAVGREGTETVSVEDRHTADAYGNSGLAVLASPALVGLLECAAIAALADLLGPKELTVGGSVEFEHEAPTPVGEMVTAHARVTSVEGRKVWFDVSAEDATGRIAKGRHARYLVDRDRFLHRMAETRAAEAGSTP